MLAPLSFGGCVMGWVKRVPLGDSYFCACPPCGLCYNWVDDAQAVVPQQVEIMQPVAKAAPVVVVDGLVKMARDLGVKRITKKKLREIKKLAKAAHVAKRATSESIDKVLKTITADTYDKAQADSLFAGQLNAAGALRRRAAKIQGTRVKQNVLLDQVDIKVPLVEKETGRMRYAPTNSQIVQRELIMSDGSTQWINT